MLRKIIKTNKTAQSVQQTKAQKLRQNIKHHKARVGGTLFGPVPEGGRREFFCLDEYTWIWYEEWTEHGKRKSRTTRYNVMNNGIVKAQDGQAYRLVSREESLRLLEAARAYQNKVEREVYQPILQSL